MSSECKEEVERDEARSSQDYRLNFKLAEACKRDTDHLCPNMCEAFQACGGQVLRCLTEKSEQIEAKACRDEVFYFKKMEVTDFRNDVLLAEACRDDVDQYCNKVKPGQHQRRIKLCVDVLASSPAGLHGHLLLLVCTEKICKLLPESPLRFKIESSSVAFLCKI